MKFYTILILNSLLNTITGVEVMNVCNIEAAGYYLVREVLSAYAKWHQATDKLVGTAVYGTQGDNAWSTKYDHIPFTEYMFITVDGQYWIVMTKTILDNYFDKSM